MNYDEKMQFYLRMMIKDILKTISTSGFEKDQHFYIAFNVNCGGVEIDDELKRKHKNELVIILEPNEFRDLRVTDTGFWIILYFDQAEKELFIPFTSIVNFIDPSKNFSLTFTPKNTVEIISNLENDKSNILYFPVKG